jgi:hypothetical protein
LKKILLVLLFVSCSNLNAQVWQEYTIATGITNNINFTSTSNLNSNYTPGNRGIFFDNASADTNRTFFPLDIVNDANAYPFRTTVRIGNVTGILIDPYHVLTAGHIISFSAYFGTVKVEPGYSKGNEPYNYAYPEKVYLLSNYYIGSNTDIGIIKLDRPLGVVTGWNGIGYNNDDNFFANNIFNNPSFPSAGLFNGEEMYNWTGSFDCEAADALYSYRTGISGMSGSGAFTKVNGNNVEFGIVTSGGIKFNRITPYLFDAVNWVVSANTPQSFTAIPMNMDVFPKLIENGNTPDSITFIVHNYSAENKNNANITASVYLSSDSIITTSDDLIGTYNYTINLNSKSSVKIKQINSLSAINKPNGYYWIGIKLSGDGTSAGSITNNFDICKIEVTNTDKFKISGRIISTRTMDGIGGVVLSGFPNSTLTDYKGYYECYVPIGWNGNIIPQKEGYIFNNSSTNYNNINANVITNYSTTTKTFTLSGNIKSPISQKPVSGVKMASLVGEPITDSNGNYSATVYYGWSGYASPSKGMWYITPYLFSYSKVTTSKSETMTAGFYINGYIYDQNGIGISNVSIQGLPQGNVKTDSTGYYNAYLDSGWTGTITPILAGQQFSPASMSYSNLSTCYSYQNYYETQCVTVNMKIMLSGCYVQGTDTMSTILNRKNLIPFTPPDSVSGNTKAFIYKRKLSDSVSADFFNNHRNIVDWVIIELRNIKNKNQSVDTVAAFIRNDGRLLSLTGDTLVPLDARVTQSFYYVIIRHRNHVAVMTKSSISLTYASTLYDFTTGTGQYYGNTAELLKTNFYGMFCGDANYDGAVTIADFAYYDNDTKIARNGYITTDFNLDGYITGTDYNLFAPNKRNNVITKIP